MLKFVSSVAKGLVAAGVILAAASILIPARPHFAPDPAVDEIGSTVAVAPLAPVLEPPAAQEPLLDAKPQPSPVEPAPVEPAPVETAPVEPAPAQAQPAPSVPEGTAPAAPIPPAPAAPEPDALAIAAPDTAAPEVALPSVAAPEMPSPPAAPDTEMPQSTVPQPAVPDPTNAEPAAPDAPAADLPPPLVRYAASFDDPGTAPLYAVILHDTGGADVDRAALAALPFPVTFAIDPETPNATEMMAIYRAAGKEVVMLVAGLPIGATAQDLEQSFQTYEAILPETVAVMGPPEGGFQSSAVLAKLIVPVIAGQGRGMITFDRGLNSAAQVAVRENLPHAVIFRQIDANGESATVIGRYLVRGTFKAREEANQEPPAQPGAIVMGQTLPDTITALIEWSLAAAASDITLAPVSALMK